MQSHVVCFLAENLHRSTMNKFLEHICSSHKYAEFKALVRQDLHLKMMV